MRMFTWLVVASCLSQGLYAVDAAALRAVGTIFFRGQNNETLGKCRTFAVGPKAILTAGHCIKNGAVGADVYLDYQANKAQVQTKVTGTVLTGGGFDPRDQLEGRDWALLYTEDIVADGKNVKFLELSTQGTPENTPIDLVTIEVDNRNNIKVVTRSGKVVRAPDDVINEENCGKGRDLGGGKRELICNFFTHSVQVGEGDSGSPFFTADGKVVGIHTGRRVNAKQMASSVTPWAGNLNESPSPSANVYYHWYVFKNYHWMNVAAELSKGNPLRLDIRDKSDTYAQDILLLLQQWNKLGVRGRMAQLFKWESLLAQEYVHDYGKQIFAQLRKVFEAAKRRPMLDGEAIDVELEDRFKVERPKRTSGETFGVYYNAGGTPQKAIAYRYHTFKAPTDAKEADTYIKFAKTEYARVAALEKAGFVFRTNELDLMKVTIKASAQLLRKRESDLLAYVTDTSTPLQPAQPAQPKVVVQVPVQPPRVLISPAPVYYGGFTTTTVTSVYGGRLFGRGFFR